MDPNPPFQLFKSRSKDGQVYQPQLVKVISTGETLPPLWFTAWIEYHPSPHARHPLFVTQLCQVLDAASFTTRNIFPNALACNVFNSSSSSLKTCAIEYNGSLQLLCTAGGLSPLPYLCISHLMLISFILRCMTTSQSCQRIRYKYSITCPSKRQSQK